MYPTFVADAMLGATARKLRALGFDTEYFERGLDPELKKLARSRGRIILTSDKALSQLAAREGVTTFFVNGRSEVARFRSIALQASLNSVDLARGPTRCTSCNQALTLVAKEKIGDRVPSSILTRHRTFYECPRCGKLFWKGSQWSRLRRLSYLLRQPVPKP
ncbi:MAG: Mut7-C RNAse domain-containing protein [Thaumarchaeota archaeon]|nr:Mut7-C RNAse domain-containing protein [Nitrososphaerota archaeon]